MLTLLGIWICLAIIFFGLGLLLSKILDRSTEYKTVDTALFFDFVWLGLFLAICVLQLTAIVLPIGKKSLLLLAVGSAIGYLWSRPRAIKCLTKINAVIGFLIVLAVSYAALGKVGWYDTGLYHLQAMKWLTNFGYVPGLGNIHGRFAFNSAFHLFAGQVEAFGIPAKACHVALPFLYCLTICDLVLNGLLTSKSSSRYFALLTLPYIIAKACTFELPSLSTDAPSYLVAVAVFIRLLRFEDTRHHYLVVCALSLLSILFKLTNLPIVLAPILLLFIRKNRPLSFKAIAGLYVFALSGYLIRNIIHSGWLLYPFTQFDFPVDWKVPYNEVWSQALWIKSWARIPGKSPQEVLDHGFLNWFVPWFKAFIVHPEFYFFIASLVLVPFARLGRMQWFSAILALSCIAFWFFQAPDLRFGGIFFWILFATVFTFVETKKGRVVAWFAAVYLLVCLLGDLGARLPQAEEFSWTYIPIAPRVPFTAAPLSAPNAVQLYTPVNTDQCWDDELFCTPNPTTLYEREPGNIKAGFRY